MSSASLTLRLFFSLAIIFLCACSKKSAPPTTPVYRAEVVNPDYLGAMLEPQTGAVLVWGTDGSIQRSVDGTTWNFVATPVTTKLLTMGASADKKTLIAAGEQGTLLRSVDQGHHWQKISLDTPTNLKTLLHSSTHNRWFAGGNRGVLLTSADGEQWHPVELGKELSLLDIESLFELPDSTRVLLGGTRGLFGVSDDGGNSWNLMQLDMDTPLSGFYAFGKTLIATSAQGKILVSRDGGNGWQLIETDGQAFFNDAAYDPHHNAIVLVSHNGKVLRSIDDADSWQLLSAPFHGVNNYLARVVVDTDEKILRAFGHHSTHLFSRDGGASWESQTQFTQTPFENVLPLAHDNTFVGYGRGGLLASSRDQGKQWHNHLDQLDIYWRTAVVTPAGSWIVAGELGFILRSADQGTSWQLLDIAYTNPMTPPTYRALMIEPQSHALIAAGPTGTITRSVDDGKNWSEVHYTAFAEAEAFTDLLIDPFHQRLIAVEADGRHYVSENHGQDWLASAFISDGKFWHGAVLASATKSTLIIAGQAGSIARSQDGGSSWHASNSTTHADLFGSYADNTHQQFFLLGAGGVLLRSRDHGESWQTLTTPHQADLRRMIADPVSGALLAFGGDGIILRSTDKGDSWQVIASGTTQELREATIDPDTQSLLIAGRDGKIIRSDDGGRTWVSLPTHSTAHLRSLTLDPSSGAVIAVGERILRLKR